MDNEGNEWNRITAVEQKKVQGDQISAILEGVKALNEKVDGLKKENRTIREELRNVGKLRPLRSEKEETQTESQVEDPAGAVVAEEAVEDPK